MARVEVTLDPVSPPLDGGSPAADARAVAV